MRECISSLISQNPDINHSLYDDADCREFIQLNFDEAVVQAYDTLIPTAFKADLWRYCILHQYGGIYLDIKFKPTAGFQFSTLFSPSPIPQLPMLTLERKAPDWIPGLWDPDTFGIYNGFMITPPRNPIMLECITRIVHHTQNRILYPRPSTAKYMTSALYITGPGLLAEVLHDSKRGAEAQSAQPIGPSYDSLMALPEVRMYYGARMKPYASHEVPYISTKKGEDPHHHEGIILEMYDEYRQDLERDAHHSQRIAHYTVLWNQGKVYRTPEADAVT